MSLFWSVLFIFGNVVSFSSPMDSSKALEGYPSGYLADCPTADRDPIITKNTLKKLSFQLHVKGTLLTAKKVQYNYYEMSELAQNPHMDFRHKTVLYVGGFLDSPNFPIATTAGVLYKKLGYNVLLLDTNYFTTMQYPLAALYMRTVGRHTAEMLVNLTRQGFDPKKFEMVGLSLGGQTISFIAKNYRQMTGMNISRLTGLDPAGPCFRNLGPEGRLDKSDADFVDTVNTNIDGFGMAAPVGHVNFYVNGGEYQPGDFLWMPCNVLCSHIRAYTLWLSAIQNPDTFIAMPCNSVQEARYRNCYDKVPLITNVVGLTTDRMKEGIFYLATDQNFPYYLGKKGLKRENEFFSKFMKSIIKSNNLIL